ncbi:MAG: hypothetical protein WCD18_06490 [Thermosynechococcaceae cyanobacterium]
MQDSPFVIFLGFGFLWIILGIVSLFFLFKSNYKEIHINPEAILVTLPIVIAFIVALTFGVITLKH